MICLVFARFPFFCLIAMFIVNPTICKQVNLDHFSKAVKFWQRLPSHLCLALEALDCAKYLDPPAHFFGHDPVSAQAPIPTSVSPGSTSA